MNLRAKQPPPGAFDYLLDGAPRLEQPLPPPPERGRGPRRVPIDVEILERRSPPRERRSPIARLLWWWLLFFLLLALAAHLAAHAEERWTFDHVGPNTLYWNDHGERGQAWKSRPGIVHSETPNSAGHVRYYDTRRFGHTAETPCP